jgi:hypothetical protein
MEPLPLAHHALPCLVREQVPDRRHGGCFAKLLQVRSAVRLGCFGDLTHGRIASGAEETIFQYLILQDNLQDIDALLDVWQADLE